MRPTLLLAALVACGGEPPTPDADCAAACTRLAEIARLCGGALRGQECVDARCADPALARATVRCADCATWEAGDCEAIWPTCSGECGGG